MLTSHSALSRPFQALSNYIFRLFLPLVRVTDISAATAAAAEMVGSKIVVSKHNHFLGRM